VPTEIGIHNPQETCLEWDPRRAAFKKLIPALKFPGQISSFAVIFVCFSILAATQEILLQSGARRGP
jgi:hypothetical protein